MWLAATTVSYFEKRSERLKLEAKEKAEAPARALSEAVDRCQYALDTIAPGPDPLLAKVVVSIPGTIARYVDGSSSSFVVRRIRRPFTYQEVAALLGSKVDIKERSGQHLKVEWIETYPVVPECQALPPEKRPQGRLLFTSDFWDNHGDGTYVLRSLDVPGSTPSRYEHIGFRAEEWSYHDERYR